jgi:hypothetical protein
MPVLPSSPPNILGGLAHKWPVWRDGGDIGPSPLAQLGEQYGCEVNCNFTFDNVAYKKGMQGRLIEKDALKAKIYIHGTTPGNRWVPVVKLNIGSVWKNPEDWSINFDLPIRPMIPQTSHFAQADTSVLGKTITGLIMLIIDSPPDFLDAKFRAVVNRENWKSIAKDIIAGIKKAGIYDVLNKPNFTADDLIRNAAYQIDGRKKNEGIGGNYIRFHNSGQDVVTPWTPNTTYAYCGQTVNFSNRWNTHQTGFTKYGMLTKASLKVVMIPLCILNNKAAQVVFYLAEQMFVCMLGTYREDVINLMNPNAKLRPGSQKWLSHGISAAWCKTAIDKVAIMTGWPGAVGRTNFGIALGANFTSPIEEFGVGAGYEKLLWVRTDSVSTVEEPGASVPMAYIRRARPSKCKAFGTAVGLAVWRAPYAASKQTLRSESAFSVHLNKSTPGPKPKPDTPVYIIFEVRLDWKPHSRSWARLPKVGSFHNWDRANSFAIRVEWEQPLGSGTWLWTYAYMSTASLLDEDIPGATKSYGHALQLIHWLFQENPNYSLEKLPTIVSRAHILQAYYDYMTQTVSFKVPATKPVPVAAHRRSEAEIIRIMKLPQYHLQNVNTAFGIQGKAGFNIRKACDFCYVCPRNLSSIPPRTSVCVQIGSSNLCTNCKYWGLPCCSWTPGIGSTKQRQYGWKRTERGTDLCTSSEIQGYWAVRAALYIQEPVDKEPLEFATMLVALRSSEEDAQSDEDDWELDITGDDGNDK